MGSCANDPCNFGAHPGGFAPRRIRSPNDQFRRRIAKQEWQPILGVIERVKVVRVSEVGTEWRQRMAGTRTTVLVSAGASAFVMCAFLVRDTSRSEAQIAGAKIPHKGEKSS